MRSRRQLNIERKIEPPRNLETGCNRRRLHGRNGPLIGGKSRKLRNTDKRHPDSRIGSQSSRRNEKRSGSAGADHLPTTRSADSPSTDLRFQGCALSSDIGQKIRRRTGPKKFERKNGTGRCNAKVSSPLTKGAA